MRNAAHNYWRDAARRPGTRGTGDPMAAEFIEGTPAPEEVESLAEEINTRVEADLLLSDQLIARVRPLVKEQTWQAFWQTAVEGRSPGDVAAQLGMKIGSVYVAKTRVITRLREAYAQLQSVKPTGEGLPR